MSVFTRHLLPRLALGWHSCLAPWLPSGSWRSGLARSRGHWLTVLGLGLLLGLGTLVQGCGAAVEAPRSALPPNTHLVRHALGETAVPNAPQRIITLGNLPSEAALVLGLTPLGAAPDSFAGNPGQFPRYFPEEATVAMTYLGDEEQPSLERIVSLQPDLILGLYPVHGSLYAQLSQIAPTVLYPVFDGKVFAPWQDALVAYGEALDRSQAAAQVFADYNAQMMQLRQQLPQAAEDYEISVLRFMPGQLRLYLGGSFAGQVLADVGFSRPPGQAEATFFERISLERLGEADGDVLVVLQSDPQGTLFEDFSRSPLWQRLRAVQADRVYFVDYDAWLSEGPIAAQRILKDLLTIFSTSQELTPRTSLQSLSGF